jgi:rod shape determining protein RodA
MIDRKLVENIDWVLIGLLLSLSILGVLVIFSSSHYLPTKYYLKQLFFIGLSLAVLFLLLAVDYRVLATYSWYLYGFMVLVFVGMLIFNHLTAKESWIRFRYFQDTKEITLLREPPWRVPGLSRPCACWSLCSRTWGPP